MTLPDLRWRPARALLLLACVPLGCSRPAAPAEEKVNKIKKMTEAMRMVFDAITGGL